MQLSVIMLKVVAWVALAMWVVSLALIVWSVWIGDSSFWISSTFDDQFDPPDLLEKVRAVLLAATTTGTGYYLLAFIVGLASASLLQVRHAAFAAAPTYAYPPQAPYPTGPASGNAPGTYGVPPTH